MQILHLFHLDQKYQYIKLWTIQFQDLKMLSFGMLLHQNKKLKMCYYFQVKDTFSEINGRVNDLEAQGREIQENNTHDSWIAWLVDWLGGGWLDGWLDGWLLE